MGLNRLRLVATSALLLGVVLCASVVVTRSLGYSPDAFVAPLFSAMWPMGLALILTGALLWVAVWVLLGFFPATHSVPAAAPRREPLDP